MQINFKVQTVQGETLMFSTEDMRGMLWHSNQQYTVLLKGGPGITCLPGEAQAVWESYQALRNAQVAASTQVAAPGHAAAATK